MSFSGQERQLFQYQMRPACSRPTLVIWLQHTKNQRRQGVVKLDRAKGLVGFRNEKESILKLTLLILIVQFLKLSFGSSEGVFSKEDVKEYDSEGKDILFGGEAPAPHGDLRGEEGVGLAGTIPIFLLLELVLLVGIGVVGLPEVNYFDLVPPVSDHDVGRSKVQVGNPVLIEEPKPICYL